MYVRRVVGLPRVLPSVAKHFRGLPVSAFGLFTANRMTFCTKTRPEPQVSPSDQLHDKQHQHHQEPHQEPEISSHTNEVQQTNDTQQSQQKDESLISGQTNDTQQSEQKSENPIFVQTNDTQQSQQKSESLISGQTKDTQPQQKDESLTDGKTNDTQREQDSEELPTDKMDKMRVMVEKYGPTLIVVQIVLATASLTICWLLVATVLDVPAILAINGFHELAQSQVFAKGGTVAIAFATHKALFPARLALAFAITPAVSRMNRQNSPFVRALGEFVDGVPALAKFRDESWPKFMKIAFPKFPQPPGKE